MVLKCLRCLDLELPKRNMATHDIPVLEMHMQHNLTGGAK